MVIVRIYRPWNIAEARVYRMALEKRLLEKATGFDQPSERAMCARLLPTRISVCTRSMVFSAKRRHDLYRPVASGNANTTN
jgi:hypothetical protein